MPHRGLRVAVLATSPEPARQHAAELVAFTQPLLSPFLTFHNFAPPTHHVVLLRRSYVCKTPLSHAITQNQHLF